MNTFAFSKEVSFWVKQDRLINRGASYLVTVTIQKQKISGFSKFEVELPEGFDIRAVEMEGSNFVKVKNTGKFIWLSLPKNSSITISYQVYVPLNAKEKFKVNSTFFYVNNKKKFSYKCSSYHQVHEKRNGLTLLELGRLMGECKSQSIYFKVQLGAFGKLLKKNDLNAIFGTSRDIEETFEDGLYKYLVGNFNDYFNAKEFQENCKIKGAFLVLYFVDVKISKQEALKIMEQ